jgi:hypothetical protein
LGAYPDVAADIFLSSGDEDAQSRRPEIPSDQKGSADDDAEDKRTTSAETLIVDPIGTDVPGKPKPSAANRASVKPSAGGVAKNAYVPQLNVPTLSLKLIR